MNEANHESWSKHYLFFSILISLAWRLLVDRQLIEEEVTLISVLVIYWMCGFDVVLIWGEVQFLKVDEVLLSHLEIDIYI